MVTRGHFSEKLKNGGCLYLKDMSTTKTLKFHALLIAKMKSDSNDTTLVSAPSKEIKIVTKAFVLAEGSTTVIRIEMTPAI